MVAQKHWMCSACGKRFADPRSIPMHVKDVHGGQGGAVRVAKSERRQRNDAEPSLAERAIEASIARAAGRSHDDDWLLPD